MQFENLQELPINDSLRDDMLFKITRSDPGYANIINFVVAGYVPPGENKRKLIYGSRLHIWDSPYLFRVCSEGVYQQRKAKKSLNDATHHHMEDIMGAFRTHVKIWQSGFFWPTMYEHTKDFIRRCGSC
jgi:hypothetical protein